MKMIKLDVSWFAQVDELMKEAFPIEERRSSEKQKALFALPAYEMYGIVKDGKLQAFLAAWDLGDMIFGEHLATDASLRGSGIGRELLMEYMDYKKKRIVFEVEHPGSEMAKRRIGFYERLGCTLYPDVPYVQPPFHEGLDPLPLHIMAKPAFSSRAEMDASIQRLYEVVYEGFTPCS